jgi:hypothetical protein
VFFKFLIIRVTLPAVAKVNEKFFFAVGSGISFTSSLGAFSSEATFRLLSEGKDAVSWAILFIKNSF